MSPNEPGSVEADYSLHSERSRACVRPIPVQHFRSPTSWRARRKEDVMSQWSTAALAGGCTVTPSHFAWIDSVRNPTGQVVAGTRDANICCLRKRFEFSTSHSVS